MKKNDIFLLSYLLSFKEIFKIFALCKLGTDDVVRCDSMGVKTQSREYLFK